MALFRARKSAINIGWKEKEMYTWTINVEKRLINAKAKKADVRRLKDALHHITRIDLYFRELTGVIGENEHSAIIFTPFGGSRGKIVNVEAYKKDLDEFLNALPDPVTDIDGTIKRANEIFERHLPVVDSRRTKEVDERAKATAAQFLADLEEKRLTWVDEHCYSRTKVSIKEDMMAVYLEITYDNSDSMTDYFDKHHQHGDDMLLAIVKKQAQTERL
jgi:hypothetical protein